MGHKKLPVGIDNFEKLRKENFYYVDKTGLIKELLDNWGEVNLFTRPRRFGKTLNMSMLKSFFAIGADTTLFDGLKISEEKALCETYMGKFPVIFVSLKDVDGLTFEDAYEKLRRIICDAISYFKHLLDSDKLSDSDKLPMHLILERKENKSDIVGSMKMLSSLLYKNYGQKVIMLIDEYDVPLDKAEQHGYYDEMVEMIRSMFSVALKSNDFLYFAVLTGCLRVSKESVFTGLNNPKVFSVSDVSYDEYFGLTDDEVHQILSEYGLTSHHKEIREWYDGYRFGEQNVYCPWDVINYCFDLKADINAEPKTYWINTSGNDMIRALIEKATDGTIQFEIEELIAGRTVTKLLNEQLTHKEIRDNVDNLWSLLYMTGYLTVTKKPSGGKYELRIPNKEVRQIFMQQVLEWFKDRTVTEDLEALYVAFEKGDTKSIMDYLSEQLLDTVSYYDAYESFYHGFLLALLSTCKDWRVISNAETGRGRCDIKVERKDRRVGFIIELKDVKDEDKLEEACLQALTQIEKKDYTAILRRYRIQKIFSYGIAFCGKSCKVMVKREEIRS